MSLIIYNKGRIGISLFKLDLFLNNFGTTEVLFESCVTPLGFILPLSKAGNSFIQILNKYPEIKSLQEALNKINETDVTGVFKLKKSAPLFKESIDGLDLILTNDGRAIFFNCDTCSVNIVSEQLMDDYSVWFTINKFYRSKPNITYEEYMEIVDAAIKYHQDDLIGIKLSLVRSVVPAIQDLTWYTNDEFFKKVKSVQDNRFNNL